MPRRDVSMVLRTIGLEYDDRLRKECESIVRAGWRVRVVVVEGGNKSRLRTIWGSVSASSLSLVTRRLFKQGKGLVPKVVEFNGRAFLDVVRNRPDVVWVHNQEAFPSVLAGLLLRRLGVVGRVVWDQHELPWGFVLRNPALRWFWGSLMRACDVVVAANRERTEFLCEQLPQGASISFSVLENRADRFFREVPPASLPPAIEAWARGRPYLLLQGGASPGRHFTEAVSAVVDELEEDVGLVVVGGYSDTAVDAMRDRWGASFDDTVFLTGLIPQMEIPTLLDNAVASLILYEASSPNSFYCAPNRLYQAIARGTPVIVGANPPMADLVSRYRLGVVLDGTGTSASDIAVGIARLMSDGSSFRTAMAAAQDGLMWEQQEAEVLRILGSSAPASATPEGSAR